MYGPGLWWPIATYETTHLMLDTSGPGDFRFACGHRSKTVLPADHRFQGEERRCKQCLAALPPIAEETIAFL